jgi:hypothetical protein
MSVVAQSPFNAGTKRALFDDENDAPRSGEGGDAAAGAAGAAGAGADSPLDGRCKRVRFAAGSSPARAAAATQTTTTTSIHPATFAALCALFPGMDDRVVSGVLAECGSDVDAAIRRLTQLRLGAESNGGDGGSSRGAGGGGSDAGGGGSVGAAAPSVPASEAGGAGGEAAAAADGTDTTKEKQPQTAEQWTDALVGEMSAARDMPDARGRASKLLAAFEAFVSARREQQQRAAAAASTAPSTPTGTTHGGGGRVGGSSTPVLQTPGGTLRSADDLVRENAILKRAVQVQHARLQQVMAEGGGGGSGSGSGSGGGGAGAAAAMQQQAAENEALRRALGECQQRVRALETTNYALALHLQRAAFGGNGDGGMGGGGGPGGGGNGDGGDGGGYFQHPFQPPPPPDVF